MKDFINILISRLRRSHDQFEAIKEIKQQSHDQFEAIKEIKQQSHDQFEAIKEIKQQFAAFDARLRTQSDEIAKLTQDHGSLRGDIGNHVHGLHAYLQAIVNNDLAILSSTLKEMNIRLSESMLEIAKLTQDHGSLRGDIANYVHGLHAYLQAIANNDLAILSSALKEMNIRLSESMFNNWCSDKNLVGPVYGGDSDRILKVMRSFAPLDVRDRRYVRVGREYDGGYVMVDDLTMARCAVSCGIAAEVSWDVDLANRGLTIYQYDHSVAAPPQQHERFDFRRLAIVPKGDGSGKSLANIVDELGELATGAILKLDVERSEWEILAQVDENVLARFSQVLVEFHDLHYMPLFIEQAEQVGSKMGEHFFVTHVHANNHEEIYSVGGIIVPRVLEVTYANRAWFDPVPLTRTFPTANDRRNDPRRPELHLGTFAY